MIIEYYPYNLIKKFLSSIKTSKGWLSQVEPPGIQGEKFNSDNF